jgi:hypothetical protein
MEEYELNQAQTPSPYMHSICVTDLNMTNKLATLEKMTLIPDGCVFTAEVYPCRRKWANVTWGSTFFTWALIPERIPITDCTPSVHKPTDFVQRKGLPRNIKRKQVMVQTA